MQYTNNFGLHPAILRAAINDPYSSGGSDFSATSLEAPARQKRLIELHKDELSVDVVSRIPAMLGQGLHSILERGARPGIDIVEKRYYAPIKVFGETYTLSAQIDFYDIETKTLSDWKTTKAFAFSKKAGSGQKPEWIRQLNVQKTIMEQQTPSISVKALQIVGILKDWEKRKVGVENGYPQCEVVTVDLPIWESAKTMEYIAMRIAAHVQAKTTLPECTKEETWYGKRCASYCDASSVCEQFKNMQKTGLIKNQSEDL